MTETRLEYPQVVRIYATSQFPDYDSPWQAQPPSGGTGSGVIIGPREVLTGAHVVANATFIQVQRVEDPDKVVARIKAISHDADLALLEVDMENFADGIEPATVGELPHLRDEVSVVGFPIGGDEISVTEGVVSRVEMQRYSHSQRSLLAVTVDAAINEGNSGGPVFKGDDVVGIAFQKLSGADNIGEMVPAPVLASFLERAQEERTVNVPGLGVESQNLENPRLREHLGLGKGASGVLISRVSWSSSAWGVLKERDALLSLDGHRIANNGTVKYAGRYRTLFPVLLDTKRPGDEVEVAVLREGERIKLNLELKPLTRLVPHAQYDVAPTYLVWGGLVFQPLSRDFLTTWEEWWDEAPKDLLSAYYTGALTEERRQVVVITRVLADDITVGYGFCDYEVVKTVDGAPVRDMADLAKRLDGAKGAVQLVTNHDSVLLYDAEEVRASQPRILERYRIPRDRSVDLDAS